MRDVAAAPRGRGVRGAGVGRCSPSPWQPPPSNQLQKYVRSITSITRAAPPLATYCEGYDERVTECAVRGHFISAVLYRRARRHYTHLGSEEKMYRAQYRHLRLTRRSYSLLRMVRMYLMERLARAEAGDAALFMFSYDLILTLRPIVTTGHE